MAAFLILKGPFIQESLSPQSAALTAPLQGEPFGASGRLRPTEGAEAAGDWTGVFMACNGFFNLDENA